jgi:hypothetical protein
MAAFRWNMLMIAEADGLRDERHYADNAMQLAVEINRLTGYTK